MGGGTTVAFMNTTPEMIEAELEALTLRLMEAADVAFGYDSLSAGEAEELAGAYLRATAILEAADEYVGAGVR